MDNHVRRLSMPIYHSFLKKKKALDSLFQYSITQWDLKGKNGKMRHGVIRKVLSVNSVRSLVGGLISNELWDYAVAC